jgi:uncharacterized protein (DUF2252 family)
MAKIDAVDVGRRAFARDVAHMGSTPRLLRVKLAKMVTSPFAFLRGSAPSFYEVLEEAPDLAEGPSGRGTLVGDAHLENFGAYRVSRKSHGGKRKHGGQVAFDVNDFDDSCVGPHRFDLVRLATSLLLAARVYGESGTATLELLRRLLEGYGTGAFEGKLPKAPASVRDLVRKVEARTSREFLASRTQGTKSGRKLTLGDRYLPLDRSVRAALPEALARYEASLPEAERPEPRALELRDAAFRVAGTGSLGCLRIAALVRGDGDGWLFDLKEEEKRPSPHRLARTGRKTPAERVRDAFVTCLERTPSRLGVTELVGKSMLVRRLTPQEDKLDVAKLTRDTFVALVPYLGALLGRVHARGAEKPGRPHRASDHAGLIERAIVLAGLHESAFLAYALDASEALR